MSLIGRFPFKRIGNSSFGPIDRPLVDVLFQARDSDRIVPIKMLIDTGADFTLLPLRYADLLGVSFEKHCERSRSQGIGGKEVVYLYKGRLRIFIFRWTTEIPFGFLKRDDIPALLGRIQCIERISLLMRRKITFLAR